AIDLGTANTVIIHKGRIVLNQPSIIAIDAKTNKVLAVGKQAELMFGKTHDSIKIVRPLRDGVIADFYVAEQMLGAMIQSVLKRSKILPLNLRIVICVPSGCTEVELRAVRDSAEHTGGREIYIIQEPMAAALGAGLNVQAAEGNMIVDIGGGTSEIAVISLGGLVVNKSIRIAGDEFTNDIQNYLLQKYDMKVGAVTAEKIKIAVGCASKDLKDAPGEYLVQGASRHSFLPMSVNLSSNEIVDALDRNIQEIERAMKSALEMTPPEIYVDIMKNGIWLAGGGALLRGLAERFTRSLGIKCNVAENPLMSVVNGAGKALKDLKNMPFLAIN
ncbi:MAG TPA: rod shape-determining protein, partial [Porphyromonadaceae bacterium]|nr:rod shape-determining protein [Porphyromonadaceae bacterium]